MKFHAWLSLSLALSVTTAGWSLWQDEASTAEEVPSVTVLPVTTPDATHAPAPHSNNDLFPYQGPPTAASVIPVTTPASTAKPMMTTSSPPPLPFQVAGAWWQGNQRFLLLTDNRQSWLLCQQCRLAGAIHRGEKLNENWQLREITPDHLVLRWLPLENDQRLALDEMQSEPGF